MIRVVYTDAYETARTGKHDDAETFEISSTGQLFLLDDKGKPISAYAPGVWREVDIEL